MTGKKASKKVYRRRIKSGVAKKAPMIDGVLAVMIEEPTPLTEANVKAWVESINNAMPDFLGKVRAWAGEVLRAAGLPDDMRAVLSHPGVEWEELPPDWSDWPLERALEQYPKGFSVCSVDKLAKDRMLKSGELTMADYAAALVLRADELERALRSGSAAQAAACGVRLGEACQRAMFAEHLEEFAVRGAKDRRDRRRAPEYRTPKTWWFNLAAALAHKSNDDAWAAIPEAEYEFIVGDFEFNREFKRKNESIREVVRAVNCEGRESYIGRDRFDEYLADARKQLKRNRKK